ncbi:MAG: SRPBCC family protein [Gemmatimonadaceae bacterium]
MVDVLTEIIIERPLVQVARFAADPDNAPAWYVNIESVEWKTAPPLRLGSEVAFVAHFLGRRLAYTYRITSFEPGLRLVMQTAQGPFPMETTYEWTPVAGNATSMRLRNRGTASGFSAWLVPFMSWSIRRANRKDLGKLKRLLETQDRP